ncbi:MAG: DUF2079 domain-containing protein [Thermoplasmata archaeon]
MSSRGRATDVLVINRGLQLKTAKVVAFAKARIGLLATILSASAYSFIFSYYAIQKYNSFRATWFDLGIETQVLWLTLHGGYNAYLQSGQNAVYTFPFTRLSYILVLPIYALNQSPLTLLVTESFLLGFAAVPLYYFARRVIGDDVSAFLIVGAYLLSFDIQGANLFDYHPENLFPLIFFTAAAAWVYGRKFVFLAAMAAGSLVDPLVSATLFFFLAQLLVRELWSAPVPGAPRGLLSQSIGRLRLLLWITRRDYHVTISIIMLLLANALAFYVSNITGELSHSPAGVSFTVAGFSSQFPDKLVYIFTLTVPTLLLFLADPLFLAVLLPFFAYILATYQPNPVLIFGGDYPVIIIPPLLVGTTFGVYRLISRHRYSYSSSEPRKPPSTVASEGWPATIGSRRPGKSPRRLTQALCVTAIAFALLFSPLSFYSPPLTYEGSSPPQNVYELTGTSNASAFLQRAVDLVPESASVLTQNNIPQLAGRLHATTFDVAPMGLQADYVLADSAVNYYSNFQVALPWIESFLQSGDYGILAQGQGAILLEEGYHGNAVLFDPYDLNLSASQFNIYPGSNLTGGLVVHNGTFGHAQYIWYGPYAQLPPGYYNVTYGVRVYDVGAPNASALTLDVLSNQTVYSAINVPFSTFGVSGAWTEITLPFHLTNYRSLMEFRGVNAETNATIEFHGAVIIESGA